MTKHTWQAYEPAKHLPLLIAWWQGMYEDGTLKTAFHSSLWELAAFIKAFETGTLVFTRWVDTGFLGCVWWQPIYSVVEAGAWSAGGPGIAHDIRRIIRSLAVNYNGVILMTAQPEVGVLNGKMGAKHQCTLPGAMDGKDLEVWYLNKADVHE